MRPDPARPTPPRADASCGSQGNVMSSRLYRNHGISFSVNGRSHQGGRRMKKKAVPEWLNSSIWSTPPAMNSSTTTTSAAAADDPLHRYSPSSNPYIYDDDDVDPPAPPPPQPQPQPPPPSATVRRDVRDRDPGRLGDYDRDDEGPSAEEISRQALLLTELSKKMINIGELRRLACQGVPDNAGVRPMVWKLLLGYLPPERSLWPSELAKKRSQYKNLKADLLMNPSEITRRLEDSVYSDSKESKGQPTGMLKRSEIAHGEHPLSLGKSSIWNKYFQESEILEQIDRDVKRTHPDMIFFSGDSAYAKSNQDSLRNILIIFSKLNPGIRYVQGMNEVLAPLFYVFKTDPDEENVVAAEADTFFCFTELFSGFRDNFCQQLDNSNMGIRSTIARLSQLLKEHDEELWRHLEVTTKVNPQFYAFRWITLLLTMEFNFSDILRIWDFLLSDPEGPQETLLRVCCAMLILVRRHLIAGDFTSNLKLLQHYPPTNINHLLFVASKLRTKPPV